MFYSFVITFDPLFEKRGLIKGGCLIVSVVGYMLTWTTYGTWLQGEKRGWVNDGEVLEECVGLLQKNIQSMNQRAVYLSKSQREVVRRAILESAKRIGQEILAVTVRSNHVHVVVVNSYIPISKVVQRYKRESTHAICSGGFKGKVWTKGYDVQYCFDEAGVRGRVGYVERHGD